MSFHSFMPAISQSSSKPPLPVFECDICSVDSSTICCRITFQHLVIMVAHTNAPLRHILDSFNERRRADVNGF